MLTAAKEALVESGLLSPGDPLPPFSARMSGNLVLIFYFDERRLCLVKVGVLSQLDREYHGLSTAHSAMPRNVPKPLRLGRHRAFQVLVSSGIRHDPLVPPRSAAQARQVEEGIDDFLAATFRAFQAPRPGVSFGKLRDALMQTGRLINWSDWESYWERVRRRCEHLTPVLQHGDFAVNNIGVNSGALVFFDWEDFGVVDMPGFDVALLLLSLNNFNMQQLYRKLAGASMEAHIVQRCSDYLGIRPEDLIELYPAYLSLYVQTKSMLGYPPDVTNRGAMALVEWLQLVPVQKVGS